MSAGLFRMPYRNVRSTVPCCPIVTRQLISAVLSYIRYRTASSEVPAAQQCGVFPCAESYRQLKSTVLSYIRYRTASLTL